jgi:hypothetical protein
LGRYGSIIMDIRSLLSGFTSWSVSYVRRECNEAAHKSAKLAVSYNRHEKFGLILIHDVYIYCRLCYCRASICNSLINEIRDYLQKKKKKKMLERYIYI